MAYEYDRIEREDGGGSFLMGLLAGTVLGAGLGMLFAPKAGADTRKQLTEQANRLRSTAGDTYQQASEKISAGLGEGQPDRRSRPRSLRSRPHRIADDAADCGDGHDRLSLVAPRPAGNDGKNRDGDCERRAGGCRSRGRRRRPAHAAAAAHGGRTGADGAHGSAAGVVRSRAARRLGRQCTT